MKAIIMLAFVTLAMAAVFVPAPTLVDFQQATVRNGAITFTESVKYQGDILYLTVICSNDPGTSCLAGATLENQQTKVEFKYVTTYFRANGLTEDSWQLASPGPGTYTITALPEYANGQFKASIAQVEGLH